MALYIDAVFLQDFGISGAEKARSVDWILDFVVRPEFEKLSGSPAEEIWCVMRLDDNNNEFIVQSGLSFQAATALSHEFERKGHKQVYWVRRQ